MYLYIVEYSNEITKDNVVFKADKDLMVTSTFTAVPVLGLIDKVDYNCVIPYLDSKLGLLFYYLSDKEQSFGFLKSEIDKFKLRKIYTLTRNMKDNSIVKDEYIILKDLDKSFKYYGRKGINKRKMPRKNMLGVVSKITYYQRVITYVDVENEEKYYNMLKHTD